MTARTLPGRDYAALKAATGALLDRVDGPTAGARKTRVAASLLSRYGLATPEHETTFAPIDVVADLEGEAGEPVVTRVLADLAGFDLAPRERRGKPADYDGHDTDLTRACCAILVRMREARADGSLDAAELIQLEALAGELSRELAEFRADAQRDIGAADRALGAAGLPASPHEQGGAACGAIPLRRRTLRTGRAAARPDTCGGWT